MKIELIEIKNYGPFYGEHTFSFSDRGLSLVMGDNQDEPRMDSNGAGKSSIFDALDWCLFGKIPRGDHADSICNEESKYCEVRVHLKDDAGVGSTVMRSRGKKNNLVFVEGSVDRTALDMKETQQYIERYLGLDRDVFHAAVLFGQMDLVHYADSTDSQRMEILTKILRLDEVDKLLERAKVKINELATKRGVAEGNLLAQEAVLLNLKSVDFSVQIQNWEDDRAAEVRNLQDAKERNRIVVNASQESLNSLPGMRTELAQLEKALYDLVTPSSEAITVLKANIAVEERNRDSLSAQTHKTKALIEQYQATLSSPQPVCESCGQVVSTQHIQEKLTALEAQARGELEGYQESRDKVLSYVEQLTAHQTEYDKQHSGVQATRNDLTGRVTTIKGNIQTIELQEANYQKAMESYRGIERILIAKQLETNPFIDSKKENENKIKAQEYRITAIENDVKNLGMEYQYLEFWVKALGAKGLKSYILDSRLQELTDAANQWVRILTGGTIWVQFEAQKQTRGKKLVNSPDIRVCRWNSDNTITERNFKSWSGGEKQRISFAIDFGLSRLIANRAKQSYDLLILDEVFKHLDRSGKEAVMEMLQTLAAEKSSVLVVEHDTEFQGSFEHRIVVQKKNRRSTILEVDNGKKESIPETTNVNLPVREPVSRQPIRTPI